MDIERNDFGLIQAPQSIDAEQSVLGALMLKPSALSQVDDWLTEDDFYDRGHRMIYRAVRELTQRQQAVDPVTMAEWFEVNDLVHLTGGPAYFLDIANSTPSAANIVGYSEIVAEKGRLRAAMRIGTELTAAATGRHADSSIIIAKGMHELTQLQPAGTRGGLMPIKGALKSLFEVMVQRHASGPGLLGLATPWKGINTWTKGLRPVFYIVAARPSMGKSIFALELAAHAALNGVRVAFFSAEMSADECMARMVACVARVPYEWVEQPIDCEDSELYWGRVTGAYDALCKADLLIDDTPGIRRGHMRARAMRAHRQKPLGLIVLDHLHDMGEEAGEEKRIAVGRNTQACKDLTKLCRCPVLAMAQLSRPPKTASVIHRPTLTDLRETGEIEQKGDVIAALHREDYYDKNSSMKGIVEFLPLKGRNLRLGETIYLGNVFEQMRMTDWESDIPSYDAASTANTGGWRRKKGGLSYP
jgi:replicative DNA helicase